MGLQLRVRHSLGARIVEVDGGAPDRPVRVGRDPSVAVQVPSGAVLPVHCLLYQQNGRWMVRQADASAAVAVNGRPIDRPTPLEFGDSIALGSGAGAAVLELDPLGTARRASRAPSDAARRPASPKRAAPAAAPAVTQPPVPQPPPPRVPGTPIDVDLEDEEDERWDLGVPAQDAVHRPVRPPKQSGQAAAIVACLIVGAIFAFLVYLLIQQMNKAKTPPVIIVNPPQVRPADAPPPPPAKNTQRQPDSIFDFQGEKPAKVAPPPKGTVFSPTFGKNTTPPPPVEPIDGEGDPAATPWQTEAWDPLHQSPEWRNIEQAFRSLDSVRTIWACHDFMRIHPGKLQSQAQARLDSALDLLWWQRINELCRRREACATTITRLTHEIAKEAPNSAHRRQLEAERTAERDRLDETTAELAAMAYTSNIVPNPINFDELDELRKDRDEAKFAAWAKRVSASIQRTRRPPWH